MLTGLVLETFFLYLDDLTRCETLSDVATDSATIATLASFKNTLNPSDLVLGAKFIF